MRAIVAVIPLICLTVGAAGVVAGPVFADPGTPSPSASDPGPLRVDSGGIPAPARTRSSVRAVGGNAIGGPGTYEVVVVGLATHSGASPATAGNSAAVVGDLDSYYNSTTGGSYRLTYRGFVDAATNGDVCSVGQSDAAVNSAVQTIAPNLAPIGGHAGVLVISVTAAQPVLCTGGYAGQAWLGGASQHDNGHWAGASYPQDWDVAAHEIGHNFGLGHANEAKCAGADTFGVTRNLKWPCTELDYEDATSIMGFANWATRIGLGRLNAFQLDQLRALPVGSSTAITGSRDVVLVPLYGASDGVRMATVRLAGVDRYELEYRPAVFPESGLAAGIRKYPGGGVQLRVINRSSAQVGDGSANDTLAVAGRQHSGSEIFDELGMSAGTSVTLSDGTAIRVLSAGPTATVRVTRPSPPVAKLSAPIAVKGTITRESGRWTVPSKVSLSASSTAVANCRRPLATSVLVNGSVAATAPVPVWSAWSSSLRFPVGEAATVAGKVIDCAGQAAVARGANLTVHTAASARAVNSQGWRVASAGVAGRARSSSKAGATLGFKVRARSMGLVLVRGRSAARAQVRVDGRLVAVVSTAGAPGRGSGAGRYIGWAGSYPRTKPHTVTVTRIGRAGPQLVVDGLIYW